MNQEYAQKLKDPRWQKVRLRVFERDHWSCFRCGAKDKTLHVHHGFYDRREPWEYPLSSLYTLCEDCHGAGLIGPPERLVESPWHPAPRDDAFTAVYRLMLEVLLNRPDLWPLVEPHFAPHGMGDEAIRSLCLSFRDWLVSFSPRPYPRSDPLVIALAERGRDRANYELTIQSAIERLRELIARRDRRDTVDRIKQTIAEGPSDDDLLMKLHAAHQERMRKRACLSAAKEVPDAR